MNCDLKTIAAALLSSVLLISSLWVHSLLADDADLARLMEASAKAFRAEREIARKELERYTEKRDQSRRITAARDWALSSFEAEERGIYATPKVLTSRMRRAKKVSDTLRQYLLSYPNNSQTRMEIRKGRALNWFLAALGPTALDHELMREEIDEKVRESREHLKALLSPPSETGSPGDRSLMTEPSQDTPESAAFRTEQIKTAKLELSELEEYQRIITREVGGRAVLNEAVRKKIVFRVGESGTPYQMRNTKDSALPLRWPVVLRRNKHYTNARKILEQAREKAIQELRDNGFIEATTQNTLFYTADALDREFQKDYDAFCKRMEANPVKNHQYARANTFIRGLRTSLYQFVQAESISDVAVDKPFDGDRIEQLLAYMSRNGFQFAEAEITSEVAYRILYSEMVNYYINMKNLQLSQREAKASEDQWQVLIESNIKAIQRDVRDDLRKVVADATRPDKQIHVHFGYHAN
jgi:hypothetical protein